MLRRVLRGGVELCVCVCVCIYLIVRIFIFVHVILCVSLSACVSVIFFYGGVGVHPDMFTRVLMRAKALCVKGGT